MHCPVIGMPSTISEMRTSHFCMIGVAVLALTTCASGCAIGGGETGPRQTPLAWSELDNIVAQATRATVVANGAAWQPDVSLPSGECATTEGDYDDQSMIPASSGTEVVWSGRMPIRPGEGGSRRILRDHFETPWKSLGFDTRYEAPSPLAERGRVVATLDGSQQLVLAGALDGETLQLEVRVACYTSGLPTPR